MVKFRSAVENHWGSGAIGAALAVLIGLLLFGTRIGWDFTRLSYDIPFGPRRKQTVEDVVIIYLDQKSHEILQQPYDLPWDRAQHARLLDVLRQQGSRTVVFDIIFSQNQGMSPSTEALVQAVKNHGKVVLAADCEINTLRREMKEDLPFEEIRQAAAGWGNVRWMPDLDMGIRSQFPNLTNAPVAGFFPTLAWTAARVEGVQNIPESEKWINYYGPPGTIPHLSYYEIFEPGFPTNYFSNKVVFIGSKVAAGFTGEGKDEMATPYTVWGEGLMPGVEIHATTFLNLVRHEWNRRIPPGIEFAWLVVVGSMAGFGLARLHPLPALGVAFISMVLFTAAAIAMMWFGRLWFNWMLIVAVQIPVALVWTVAHNSLHAYIAKQVLQRSLSLYLSPTRASQIIKNPDLLKPGAEEKEVTLLFTDIADFSNLSQKAPAKELVEVLNDYFQTALASIHKTDGTVVKFIGDAIFAMWNAPENQPDHQELACRAVAQLHADLTHFNRVLKERFASAETSMVFNFRTRIGLHCGKAFVGNFGSSQRFDYTAIGDTVNFSSRLEGLNKYVGTEVLMSGEFHAAIAGRCTTRLVGNFKPKGFLQHLPVYELIGPSAMAEETREWREAFADGWRKFCARQFDEASTAFHETCRRRNLWHQKKHPGTPAIDDGPSMFYLKQIRLFRTAPPPGDWQGEVEPEGK